jgi:F420H(2)-dependent quinone reductase
VRFPKPLIRLLGRVHGAIYRATDGRLVGNVGEAGVLLLTTTGRRSGTSRTVPLLYVPDGDAFVVVASLGGHDTHPAWCLNLRANPAATVQIGTCVMGVQAEELTGEARDRLWASLTAVYGGYAEYRTRTSREFPIIALRPAKEALGA